MLLSLGSPPSHCVLDTVASKPLQATKIEDNNRMKGLEHGMLL
jgi:hypothetical protein